MQKIIRDDAEIFYEIAGSGPPVVLLHPTPADHEFFLPVSQFLSSRYRLIMPDLRGHGESSLGNGPATMQKHAVDIVRPVRILPKPEPTAFGRPKMFCSAALSRSSKACSQNF